MKATKEATLPDNLTKQEPCYMCQLGRCPLDAQVPSTMHRCGKGPQLPFTLLFSGWQMKFSDMPHCINRVHHLV